MAVYGKKAYKARSKRSKARKNQPRKSAVAKKASMALRLAKTGVMKHHLYQDITNIDPQIQPYNYYNLTQWNNMSSIFGTALNDWSNANKLFFNKMTLNVKLEMGSENDFTTGSIYIVTLKDAANTTSRFNASTGALALNNPTDFVILNGRTFLNPKVFNIIKHKRYYIGNGGQGLATSGVGDSKMVVRDYCFKVYPKHYVQAVSENVRDLVCSRDPNKCFYLLTTCDNLLSDFTAPQLSVNAHYQVTTAN